MDDDVKILVDKIKALIAESQERLKCTGIICVHCGNPGASAEEEADHNTGDCGCPTTRALCWREWWGRCHPKDKDTAKAP